ncbi:hypothetical protein [Blastococcus sp. VKM Ac-2987]|uniref:hypothetical protein n=1 Tax=Blastococcus sp. VKM Ac-2987 TaxID=3004141 RepID=UPI0022AB9AE9|nr:hypothetical protein [Blastococcus sp. VKM Ac-2987]MCZ2857814.1 hypothetical protein [Blastococcus sp. VKM Ac-2987]
MTKPRQWSDSVRGPWLTREKALAIIIGPLLVAGFTVWLTSLANEPETELDIVDLRVLAGSYDPAEDAWEPPRVQVRVRNVGDQVSVISGARLKIVDYQLLPYCEAGGTLTVSETYDVSLPATPAPNPTLDVFVSQEVGQGETDFFEFALQVPDEDRTLAGSHAYQLSVEILHDGQESGMEAGTAIIESPMPYGPDEQAAFAEDPSSHEDFRDCVRAVLEDHRRTLGWEGVRAQ